MTNMQTIAGSALWVFISGLLFFAALEPVTVSPAIQLASTQSAEAAA